jgi:hypothetical protein
VLRALGPAEGAGAVLSVKNLLDRFDAFESSPDRQPTREVDRAALATLEARGLGAAERTRLRGLVKKAEGAAVTASADLAGEGWRLDIASEASAADGLQRSASSRTRRR